MSLGGRANAPSRIRRPVITVQPSAKKARRNRESEVIDAAIRVFWLRGYSGASIQEIADEVGVLKGSLYHYIGSKEELLARIFQEAYEESLGVMSEINAMNALAAWGSTSVLMAPVSRASAISARTKYA